MKQYNQTLQTNNFSLEEIITQINNLPEAGGTAEDLDAELTTQEGLIQQLSTILDSKASGGSGGGETITINVLYTPEPGQEVWYIDGNMTLQQKVVASGDSYTILKGTLLMVLNCSSSQWLGLTAIGGNNMYRTFLATSETYGDDDPIEDPEW